ncbi:MAG: hypothetical protein AB2A00_43575, partial [Myxococcota bacterium]
PAAAAPAETPAPVENKPPATPEQMVEKARAFAKAVGATVGEAVQHSLISSSHKTDKLWHVVFPDQATVDIDERADRVVFFSNDARVAELQKLEKTPETLVKDEEARARAVEALKAAGVGDDVIFKKSAVDTVGKAPALLQRWKLHYPRVHQKVRFRNQGVELLVDAHSGNVLTMDVNFYTPPPKVVEFPFPNYKAGNAARDQLRLVGVPNAGLSSVEEMIVEPNRFWQDKTTVPAQPVHARAVWVATFHIKRFPVEVWLDGVSGSVVGGWQEGDILTKPPPELPRQK